MEPSTAPDTPSGTILQVGETWHQGGLELTLQRTDLAGNGWDDHPGIVFQFTLSNQQGQDLPLRLTSDTFVATDGASNGLRVIWVNLNSTYEGEIDESRPPQR